MNTIIVSLIVILLGITGAQAHNEILNPYRQHYEWANILLSKISWDIQSPYHVIIFNLNNSVVIPEFNYIIQRISQMVPVTIVNFTMITTIRRQLFKRTVAFNLMLSYDKDKILNVRYAVKRVADYTWRIIPTKFLVVHLHEKATEKMFHMITKFAWIQKHLDFTVVEVRTNGTNPEPLVHYLNPFKGIHHCYRLADIADVFPSKLIDLNGYELVALAPEYIYVDEFGVLKSAIDNDKSFLPSLQMIIRKLNISVKLVYSFRMNQLSGMWITVQMIDARGWKTDSSLREYGRYCHKIMAIVPIIPVTRLNNVDAVIMYITVFIAIAVVVVIFGKVLTKNAASSRYWRIMNMAKLLIGMSVDTQPHNMVQNIFFLIFSFISMIYTADFYSSILDVRFVYGSVPLHTLKQINDSLLPLYTYNKIYEHIMFENSDPYIMDINRQKRFQTYEELGPCIELVKNLSRICLATENELNVYLKLVPKKVMVTDPGFPCIYLIYAMNSGSVLYETFQKLLDRLAESGIVTYWRKSKKYVTDDIEFVYNKEVDVTFKIFILVVGIGCGSSFVCFTGEMICGWIVRRRKMRMRDSLSRAMFWIVPNN